MGLALALEDFDGDVSGYADGEASGDPEPSEDWQAGHAEGRAEAEARGAADQGALRTALVQRLEDMAFGYAEARATLLNDLKPLFETLSATLLPRLQDDLLVAHLAQALSRAAVEDLSQPVVLRVSASDVVAVSDLLAQASDIPFICRSDPSLPAGAAIISGGSANGALKESSLDIVELTESLRAILSAFATEQPQETAHG